MNKVGHFFESASTDPKKRQYHDLRVIIGKLQRGVTVTDEELQQLQRQIEQLEMEAWCLPREGVSRTPAFRRQQRQIEGCNSSDLVNATKTIGKMFSGHATSEGVKCFAAQFGKESVAFYRPAQDVLVSSVGIGTCRGAIDDDTDAAYAAAVHAALDRGVNLIDTSINYRDQRSERAVGAGIRLFIEESGGKRDGVVVCTKGGYLVSEALTAGILRADDVVGGIHSMAPAFLGDQIERSRRNLGLETIDVYYLHNPETQLKFVGMSEFMNRIRVAFDRLECAVSEGLIRWYGTATWHGYRCGAVSLRALAETANQVAGDNHHFRFVELPFNLGMREALTRPVEYGSTVLDFAIELGITVIASAALFKAFLSRDLPEDIAKMMPGLTSEAQRAIQFTRSTPGIASALVGMRDTAHVLENLAVARTPPLTPVEYQRFFSTGF